MMAIGIGKMLGFAIPENFHFPYMSKSVTEFWRRWHITLGRWFREYVYIPLGGNRKGKARTFLNLIVVWSLTALWHGSKLNFLIWGGALLALVERAGADGEGTGPAAVRAPPRRWRRTRPGTPCGRR